MKKKIKKYTKEIIVFFIFMTIFANIISLYRSIDLNKNSLNIQYVTLLNNIEYTIPKDKTIMIHFWATWCPTCKLEASNIQKISEEYEVLTIAIKSGSDSEIEQYLKDNNLNYRVVNDHDGAITDKFGVSIFPTTIIYNRKRDAVFSDVGYTSTLGLWLRMWWASF
ncbi:MAG: redoxin domain-containing protein [Sulfurimonas sp.]|nr:redoxin domain-containing protein [Sulfurimonas sp.]